MEMTEVNKRGGGIQNNHQSINQPFLPIGPAKKLILNNDSIFR
jgi:hypothetical protein